jgi:hypothetical protein
LDVQLRAIKETLEEGLIGFGKCFFERHPSSAFSLNEMS